jgi:hypothetical protein
MVAVVSANTATIFGSRHGSSSSRTGYRFAVVVVVLAVMLVLLPLIHQHRNKNNYGSYYSSGLWQFIPTTTTTATTTTTSITATNNTTSSSISIVDMEQDNQAKNHNVMVVPSSGSYDDGPTHHGTNYTVLRPHFNSSSNDSDTRSNRSIANTTTVFCLSGIFGRNCNSIIQLANALHKVQKYQQQQQQQQAPLDHNNNNYNNNNYYTTYYKVGLPPGDWTERYLEFFDPRHEILFNYTGTCHFKLQAKRIHYSYPKHKPNMQLMQLTPKVQVRQAAEAAIQDYIEIWRRQQPPQEQLAPPQSLTTSKTTTIRSSYPFLSVHRRWLEGSCHIRSDIPGENFCINTNHKIRVQDTCEIVYSNITDDYYRRYYQQPSPSPSHQRDEDKPFIMPPVLLFTDGQKPELDQTFPFRDSHPFAVQLWMMTLSPIHYGNPVSSVDHVVNHWRQGEGMEPASCFPSFQSFGT